MKCSRQRCKGRARFNGLCKTHARQVADDAFSDWIRRRDGRCENCGAIMNLQCAHVISRGARYIQFDPRNAMALCASCHLAFTVAPHRWDLFIEERFPGLRSLLAQAEAEGQRLGYEVDLAEVLERFEAAS